MKRRLLLSTCLLAVAILLPAQAPNNYYQKTQGKKGRELKNAFFEIIKNPAVVHYDSLWYAYNISDPRTFKDEEGVYIWDMYSGISRYPLYTYKHGSGSGTEEGVKGIQREHSMVKSWFNPTSGPKSGKNYEDVRPMYSDIVHVIPTDAVCNNNRRDNPYGTNNGEAYTSKEGFSKLGACTYVPTDPSITPFTGKCFEPNDEYKGDLARIYFYMVMCYAPGFATWDVLRDPETKAKQGEVLSAGSKHCGTWTCDMFNTADTDEGTDAYQPFAPWAFDMLMKWSKEDAVSQKEIDRNEKIWQLQGNRNPFVDYPGLEDYIWGDKKEEPFNYGGENAEEPKSNNCELALNKNTFGVDWSATENLCDYWNRTPITIEKNGITFTYSFGMEGSKLYADDTELRLYNYNTLTLKAHNNTFTRVELTLGEANHTQKTLVASEGTIDNNVWTGEASEIIFASNYVSGTKSGGVSVHYYLPVSNIKVTVANPTGIEQMQAPRYEDNRIFNLMGVQMDESQLAPGIYIKNGKKVIYK